MKLDLLLQTLCIEFSFTEVTILALLKQSVQIWLPYSGMRHALAANGNKLTAGIITPGLTWFSNDKIYVILLFSKRPVETFKIPILTV